MDYSLIVLICLFCGGAIVARSERIRYDNYRVYAVTANSTKQLELLSTLDGSSDSLIFLDGVHSLAKSVNVVVAPHKVPDFVQTLEANDFDYELIEKNAQEKMEHSGMAPRSAVYRWTAYHELDDTYAWLKSIAAEYPGVVTLFQAGKTYEKRQILGAKVSYKKGNPGVFIEGGMHAREWISPATVTYIMNQLLTSDDDQVREIAENHDWYFVPHSNPDGYDYTHKRDRMWRKTRSPNGVCYGADPNRNWGFHWNEIGASSLPCSDTYAGSRAFSEIETKTLSQYIASLGKSLRVYISLHSYSQLFLYPYGHTDELPPNQRDLETIFDVVKSSISKRYGTRYTGGNVYRAIYPAAGASIDWVYGVVGTKLSFCYELRPSNGKRWNGFILPPEQIIPTGEETLDSIVALLAKAKQLGYF